MEDIKDEIKETFEEKVKSLKETIDTLDDWKYDFEEKIKKLDRKLNFVKDDLTLWENS